MLKHHLSHQKRSGGLLFGDFGVDCLSMVPLLGKILSSLYGKHRKAYMRNDAKFFIDKYGETLNCYLKLRYDTQNHKF